MKIRIKFSKTGNMKFIGHLDVMRYFQKAMRRAEVDIAYTEGFSPHQKMSFAAPLGVGLTSLGEYFDIEVNSTKSSFEMISALNNTMVDGIKVLSYRKLPEDSKNAMSIVAGADYIVKFRDEYLPEIDLEEKFNDFINQSEINVTKESKKAKKKESKKHFRDRENSKTDETPEKIIIDIKPLIYEISFLEDNAIFMKLCTGSSNNIKPELVMKSFMEYCNLELGKFDLLVTRLETYGLMGEKLTSLEDFGEEIL